VSGERQSARGAQLVYDAAGVDVPRAQGVLGLVWAVESPYARLAYLSHSLIAVGNGAHACVPAVPTLSSARPPLIGVVLVNPRERCCALSDVRAGMTIPCFSAFMADQFADRYVSVQRQSSIFGYFYFSVQARIPRPGSAIRAVRMLTSSFPTVSLCVSRSEVWCL
jgi:hypothetical protein